MTVAAIQSRVSYYPSYPVYPPYYPGAGYGSPYHNPYNHAFGSDSFSSVTSLLAGAGAGGVASYKLSSQMADNYKSLFGNGFSGFMGGMKQVAITSAKGAGIGALVGAGISVIGNGVQAATGRIEVSEAAHNVVTDTIASAVGGFGAVTLSGLGYLALGKMGLAGTGLTIATVALGAIGGAAAAEVRNKLDGPYGRRF